jgi:hypothetical protein
MGRCEQCKKKLGVMEYKCKCGKIFCITHLHAEEHNCTFNYQEEGQTLLRRQNVVGPLSTKVDKI